MTPLWGHLARPLTGRCYNGKTCAAQGGLSPRRGGKGVGGLPNWQGDGEGKKGGNTWEPPPGGADGRPGRGGAPSHETAPSPDEHLGRPRQQPPPIIQNSDFVKKQPIKTIIFLTKSKRNFVLIGDKNQARPVPKHGQGPGHREPPGRGGPAGGARRGPRKLPSRCRYRLPIPYVPTRQ